ncbi:MAG: lysophospholipid acyltransferase family protein [Gemmatimonadota bacterium]|nr:lysophospholipid acyltransferase family protein [Gemmatimonadota bacterium]
MLNRLRRGAIRRLGPPSLRAVAGTWRIDVVGGARWTEVAQSGRPFVLLCWHEAILPVIWHHRHRGISAMISEAQDGEYLAGFVRSIGYDLIRGSSSRGASRVLRGAIQVLREGRSVGLTPDGPRGPRRVFKPGAVAAAGMSGAVVLAVHAEAAPSWRAHSWDRTLVPAPFARVRLAYGPWFTPERRQSGLEQAIFDGSQALQEAVRLATFPTGDATAIG